MNESPNEHVEMEEQLSHLFGSYRAEWLREQIFDLYTEPSYFPVLTANKSCVLIGGRGTGKTTVLRGLSYPGRFAIGGHKANALVTWKYFGLYYRVNTNHVTAFRGPEASDNDWKKLFAHYFNLLQCDLVLEFLEWYEVHAAHVIELPRPVTDNVVASLHLPPCRSHRELREHLIKSRVSFEAYINNIADATRSSLSLQARPVELLTQGLLTLPEFQGKQFFFLIDEYENLLDDQQEVVNTLIKQAGESYCFKVGVRELGWRCRHTLNVNEQLVHPADYDRIDIAQTLQGDVFQDFAYNVCTERLKRIQAPPQQEVIRDVRQAFPGLTEDEEAEVLGIEGQITGIRNTLIAECGEASAGAISELTALELYFLKLWAETHNTRVAYEFVESQKQPKSWKDRFGNCKHALLYTIRKGKRGIKKYYAGWNTFTLLAAGNIRYVLELVDQSLLAHYKETRSLGQPVPPEVQTKVAQRVGRMNLSELEGLSVDGAQLTKLLLSLGRVFQILAADAMGHAPELNHFEVSDTADTAETAAEEYVVRLLTSAVMHLALIRSPGNKLGDVGDTKDYDYMIHPLFCPLFEFSYRRKRKMTLKPTTIVGLVKNPKKTIRAVLSSHNRTADEQLPDQLMLFERFYDADTE